MHLAHDGVEAVEDRLADQEMPDIELGDLGQGRDRRRGDEIEAVAGMDFKAHALGTRRAAHDACELGAGGDAIAGRHGIAPSAGMNLDDRRADRGGGLDVVGQHNTLKPFIARLNDAGIRVSLFIAADPAQIEAAAAIGAPVIEIHTGAWCEAVVAGDAAASKAEFDRIGRGAKHANGIGLEVHAGHGLDFVTAATIAALPEIAELNIGHFLIGEAIFDGLDAVVRKMHAVMNQGRRKGGAGR